MKAESYMPCFALQAAKTRFPPTLSFFFARYPGLVSAKNQIIAGDDDDVVIV
jgi:hypothetical protein